MRNCFESYLDICIPISRQCVNWVFDNTVCVAWKTRGLSVETRAFHLFNVVSVEQHVVEVKTRDKHVVEVKTRD